MHGVLLRGAGDACKHVCDGLSATARRRANCRLRYVRVYSCVCASRAAALEALAVLHGWMGQERFWKVLYRLEDKERDLIARHLNKAAAGRLQSPHAAVSPRLYASAASARSLLRLCASISRLPCTRLPGALGPSGLAPLSVCFLSPTLLPHMHAPPST